jgi:hypothetical protein
MAPVVGATRGLASHPYKRARVIGGMEAPEAPECTTPRGRFWSGRPGQPEGRPFSFPDMVSQARSATKCLAWAGASKAEQLTS